MKWRVASLLVLLALFLTGCEGPKSGAKIVQNPKSYANVISLSPSTTEILASAGGGSLLVGRTSACDRPEGILNVRIVARNKPDYEAIIELNPNLIIYDTTLYSDDEIAKIEDLGVETLAFDADTIEEFNDFEYKLASKLSMEMRMSENIDKVNREISAAQAIDTGDPRTTIMLGFEGGGEYLVMGDSGIHSSIISAAGGTVIGAEGRLFQVMKLEKLIDLDPEIIFTDGSALQILKDPRLQGISAVSNKHVYDVNEKTLVRIGGWMHSLIKEMNHYMAQRPEAVIEEAS